MTRNIYLTQALLFLAVNFMYLISRSVLWDGKLWYQLMFNHDFNGLMWMTFQAKLPIVFHLYAYLADSFNPILIAKVISFLSLLFAGLIFRWFLEKDDLGTSRTRFYAGFWYSLMPCYLVGIEFCHVMYNMAVFIFFLGAFIHSATMKDHKNSSLFWPLHSTIGILFYFSFAANKAFLFLYPLFIVQSLYQFYHSSPNKDFWKNWLSRYWILLLIPFIYWSFKDLPLGIYDNYNAVNLKDFTRFKEAFKIGFSGNYKILSKTLAWVLKSPSLLFISLIWLLVLWFTAKKYSEKMPQQSSRFLVLGMLGSALLMFMVIFPYAAVGKHAQFLDFESRHALLFVFPQALFILFSLSWLEQKTRYSKAIHTCFLVFIALVASSVLEAQRRNDVDWFKRQSLIENFKTSEQVQKASRIIIHDEITDWDWLNRGVEFYELNAYSQDAFGDQARLISDSRFTPDKKFIETPGVPQRYQFKNYDSNGTQIDVRIAEDQINLLNFSEYFLTKWLFLTNTEKYKAHIKNALKLQTL